MAINKVIKKGVVELDLTSDTVTPETLMSGTTAHNAAGETIVGTASSGIDTTDATATAADMLNGITAYAKGEKITGTFTIDSELTTQDNLISQIQTALQNKAAGSEPTLQSKQVTPTTSQQIIKPDSGYDGLSQVTVNAMTTATQATPSITVSTSGLITASSTQTAGYVAYGTKSATKQLTTQAAQTITPGTSNKTIASGRYLTGTQTIKGDSNLKAENIKSGVSIFGITGTHSGGEDLETIISEQEALIQELSTTLDGKASGGSGGNIETCIVTGAGSCSFYISFDDNYLTDTNNRLSAHGNVNVTVPKEVKILVPSELTGFPISITPSSAVTQIATEGTSIWYQLHDSCSIIVDD